LFFSGTIKRPKNIAINKISEDVTRYGLKNLVNDIPDDSIAIISEFEESFDVNQITEKNTKIGNKKYPKYQTKSL
tara:strand:+ start:412 stop:636 length:225 start_codon:yes stop_codon:yes gene_type:complete